MGSKRERQDLGAFFAYAKNRDARSKARSLSLPWSLRDWTVKPSTLPGHHLPNPARLSKAEARRLNGDTAADLESFSSHQTGPMVTPALTRYAIVVTMIGDLASSPAP